MEMSRVACVWFFAALREGGAGALVPSKSSSLSTGQTGIGSPRTLTGHTSQFKSRKLGSPPPSPSTPVLPSWLPVFRTTEIR